MERNGHNSYMSIPNVATSLETLRDPEKNGKLILSLWGY